MHKGRGQTGDPRETGWKTLLKVFLKGFQLLSFLIRKKLKKLVRRPLLPPFFGLGDGYHPQPSFLGKPGTTLAQVLALKVQIDLLGFPWQRQNLLFLQITKAIFAFVIVRKHVLAVPDLALPLSYLSHLLSFFLLSFIRKIILKKGGSPSLSVFFDKKRSTKI